MAKLTTAEFIDAIKELSVLELNDLVKACEEEFGVSAAAGVVVAAAGAAEAAEEKDEIDVFLPTGDQALSSVVNYVDEQKKSASFYDTEKLEPRDKYALFFGGNHAQIKISTPTETDNTLLVLKDSYANSFIPFLAQHYRKIIMIDPRYYFGDLEQLMQAENVQEILYLYIANTFFTDTSLELALTTAEQDSSDTSDIR